VSDADDAGGPLAGLPVPVLPVLGLVLLAVAGAFTLGPLVLSLPGWTLVFLEVGILLLLYGVLVVGLNLEYGFTGLVNFGHVAFFAVGGYATAIVAANDPFAGIGLGLPWPLGLALGVVLAGLLGVAFGVVALRLRDDFLAIVTLAAAEILHDLSDAVRPVTGGNVGLLGVPRPIDALAPNPATGLFATALVFGAVLLATYAVVERLVTAPYGRVLRAIRADELAAASLGKNPFRYKMSAFVYGSALAGLAGGLFALFNGAVAPGFFTLNVTVVVWIGMLLGGPANNRAVLVGLTVIMSLRLLTRFFTGIGPIDQTDFASIRLIVVGLVLVGVIRYRPEGLFGDAEALGVDR
jgi:branched-chain amino acid transport system permease protein